MTKKNRSTPRYDMLFEDDIFNATHLIGPDPWDAYYDYSVYLGARLRLRNIGFKITEHRSGYDELRTTFSYDNRDIEARIRLVHGRNYDQDLQELWQESLIHEDVIYLKSHAGYGKHISLSDDVGIFTEAMRSGFEHPDKRSYQMYYLDCCKSEMYYKEAFRDFVGHEGVDLILHKWFCDYKKVGQMAVLFRELMAGSDFETIVAEMNEEYGTPHFDVEDDPADMKLDRKMVTYSVG
ncbi:MAG: hypothetical protein M8349_05765 [ANME-2 cluster archaeon]|nr:hypothetical protein [ANME-2 cluster archaeon]